MANFSRSLSRKKRLAFRLISFLISLTTLVFVYLVYTGYRTAPLYRYIKNNERGLKGRILRPDPELGFVPIPNSQGVEVFPIGDDIPMRYDQDGFRVPVAEVTGTTPDSHPVVLALGCSFTYGFAVPAERTFPYLVGKSLGGVTKNAGVPSYGLAQMLILARRLIPSWKPDYVLVQYSPWLAQRAETPFAPTYIGKVPASYFSMTQNQFVLEPAVFRTKIMDLPTDDYRNGPASAMDKISFFWRVGLPLFAHDDFKMSLYQLSKALGQVPKPVTNTEQLEKYVYEEIAKVARENHTQMVIVILGIDQDPVRVKDELFPRDALLVDAHQQLLAHLPAVNAETYAKTYFHWRGSPPRMVDNHPNETAHKLIAEAIVQKIQQNK